MRLAEERANNEFRQHSAAWREEASNTVNFARSEIEASRFRTEIEEREKREAAIRLQEAEAEKRNLEAKLHQEQLCANQRELETQNEKQSLIELANQAEAERQAREEQRKIAEKMRRESEETAATLWHEKLKSQNEVLRVKSDAQRFEEEAKVHADLGRTKERARALEIEDLHKALASAQSKIQQSEARKNEIREMVQRLAALERTASEGSRASSQAPSRGSNQNPGQASGGAVLPPDNLPSATLSPIRKVPEAPTPEGQEGTKQPSFGAGNE